MYIIYYIITMIDERFVWTVLYTTTTKVMDLCIYLSATSMDINLIIISFVPNHLSTKQQYDT